MSLVEWFSNFFTWMQALPPIWAYVTVLLIAYGENVAPPIPGDMVVVFGGYLAGIGQLHLGVVVLLSTIGGALGFMTMFGIGYRVGERLLDPDRYQWLPRDGIEKARGWIHQYGYGVVAANRFLSGARSVIALTAGIAGMDVRRTAFWCTVSALVWTGLISYAGYAVGENWHLVVEYLRAYGRIILGLLMIVVAVFVGRWYFRQADDEPASETGPVDERSGSSSGR